MFVGRRLSAFKAVTITVGVVIVAMVAGSSVSAATESDSLLVQFEDGSSEVMCNEGLLDTTSYTYAEDDGGHTSPGRAVAAYRAETRRLAREFIDAHVEQRRASRGPSEAGSLGREMRALMAPSLNFSPGKQKASKERGVVFFDREADNGVLESRIVVHEEDGVHFVDETYRCVETITTDPAAVSAFNTVEGQDNIESDEER